MRIIAYLSQRAGDTVRLLESTGEACLSKDPQELLEFLVEPFQTPEEIAEEGSKYLQVCWDLDTTLAPIFRLLGVENCKKLAETKGLYYPPYNLFYVPSKIFHVKRIPSPHFEAFLYHLAQYYPDLEEPEKVEDIQMLGVKLLQELDKMGLRVTKLTSPVAIYEKAVMRDLDLPTFLDMPREACEYALECSGQLWIEAYKIGYLG